MGSTILDGARVGRGSLVGAGALVTPGTDIPPGSLVLGAPARVVRPVNQKELDAIEYGAAHYVELTRRYLAGEGGSSVR
jgi:carbonic anhydrase/acetyltransferase-like protein (isoleucine patch superfamily)